MSSVTVENETDEEAQLIASTGEDTSFAPISGSGGSNDTPADSVATNIPMPKFAMAASAPPPPATGTESSASPPAGAVASASPAPTAISSSAGVAPSSASSATLSLRVHSLRSSYVAQQNHFLQCDPLLVVAVDNRPLFKTSIRQNSTSCSWQLDVPADVQSVPSGLALATAAAAKDSPQHVLPPTIEVPVSSLSMAARLQVHQEDYGRAKEEDDLGSCSLSIEDLVDKAWRQAAKAGVSAPAAASSISPSAASSSIVAPLALSPGWYAISVDNAQLLERDTGRPLGEVSLQLSVHLEPYLRHLVASQTNLRLLAALVTSWMDTPATGSGSGSGSPSGQFGSGTLALTESPLRHLLLDGASLRGLIELTVRAGADKGSMDGQRLRERVFPLLHKAIDVFGAEAILPSLFASQSAAWKALWDTRLCVPAGQLSSSAGWALYSSLIEAFLALADRAANVLEPVPPPPVKSAEEIEAERVAAELAEKRAAKKRRAAAAAAAAAGEDDPVSARGGGSASSKKKKKLSLGVLPLPEASFLSLPSPSKLFFGLNTLDVLRELLRVLHTRLAGAGRRATVQELDWATASEQKLQELIQALELLWKVSWFLWRYGGTEGDALAAAASSSGGADASGSAAAASDSGRLGVEGVRVALYGRESGDPHALWLQKSLVSLVKKQKEQLQYANPELLQKLQQHADYFAAKFPTEAKPKKGTNK